jgi:hypothetical protein
MQVVPSQQPLQLAGPQVVAVTHAPRRQLCVPGHMRQGPPSAPQAWFCVPDRQAPVLSVQPWHWNVWQVKLMHVWPLGQRWQTTPPEPHAAKRLPARHWPVAASQQPLQLDGPQPASDGSPPPPPPVPPPAAPASFPPPPPVEPGRHTPRSQVSVGAQPVHRFPSAPQANSSVPGRHSPLTSQHPAQFDLRHGNVVAVGPQAGSAAQRAPTRTPVKKALDTKLRPSTRRFLGTAAERCGPSGVSVVQPVPDGGSGGRRRRSRPTRGP